MKPKFKELKNQVLISGTEKSTIKEITICIGEHEWDHNRKPGNMKVIYTFIDGKFCSELDYNKFKNTVDYTKDEICIRSGASGTAVVLISDLISALEILNWHNPDDTAIQMKRIKAGIDYAILRGNNLRNRLDSKKNDVDIKTFIRNLKDVQTIEKALTVVFDEKRNEYIKKYSKHFEQRVTGYADTFKKHEGKSMSSICYTMSSRYYNQIFEFVQKFYTQTREQGVYSNVELKSDWKKTCKKIAAQEVAAMEQGFMDKNIFKIGTIVHNKNNFKFVRVLNIGTGAFGFEGEFLIGFKDQSSFVVRSQAVYAEGPIVSGHYRYPTTFHVVQYPNGKVIQKQSEEEMINQFSKTK